MAQFTSSDYRWADDPTWSPTPLSSKQQTDLRSTWYNPNQKYLYAHSSDFRKPPAIANNPVPFFGAIGGGTGTVGAGGMSGMGGGGYGGGPGAGAAMWAFSGIDFGGKSGGGWFKGGPQQGGLKLNASPLMQYVNPEWSAREAQNRAKSFRYATLYPQKDPHPPMEIFNINQKPNPELADALRSTPDIKTNKSAYNYLMSIAPAMTKNIMRNKAIAAGSAAKKGIFPIPTVGKGLLGSRNEYGEYNTTGPRKWPTASTTNT